VGALAALALVAAPGEALAAKAVAAAKSSPYDKGVETRAGSVVIVERPAKNLAGAVPTNA